MNFQWLTCLFSSTGKPEGYAICRVESVTDEEMEVESGKAGGELVSHFPPGNKRSKTGGDRFG